jgi:hypothetical protein
MTTLMTQAQYARTRNLSSTLIKKQMKSGIIPTVGNKIDPEAADRSRAENLDPFRGRPKRVHSVGYEPAVLAVLQMLLHDGPQLLTNRLELMSLNAEGASIAVAHFAAMIEGIADGLYRGEFDHGSSKTLAPAKAPNWPAATDYERLREQALGDEFETCMLTEFEAGESARY